MRKLAICLLIIILFSSVALAAKETNYCSKLQAMQQRSLTKYAEYNSNAGVYVTKGSQKSSFNPNDLTNFYDAFVVRPNGEVDVYASYPPNKWTKKGYCKNMGTFSGRFEALATTANVEAWIQNYIKKFNFPIYFASVKGTFKRSNRAYYAGNAFNYELASFGNVFNIIKLRKSKYYYFITEGILIASQKNVIEKKDGKFVLNNAKGKVQYLTLSCDWKKYGGNGNAVFWYQKDGDSFGALGDCFIKKETSQAVDEKSLNFDEKKDKGLKLNPEKSASFFVHFLNSKRYKQRIEPYSNFRVQFYGLPKVTVNGLQVSGRNLEVNYLKNDKIMFSANRKLLAQIKNTKYADQWIFNTMKYLGSSKFKGNVILYNKNGEQVFYLRSKAIKYYDFLNKQSDETYIDAIKNYLSSQDKLNMATYIATQEIDYFILPSSKDKYIVSVYQNPQKYMTRIYSYELIKTNPKEFFPLSEQQVSSNDKLSYPIKEIKAEHLQNKLVDLRYLNYKKKIVFKDLKRINFKKLNSNYDFKWQRNVLGVHRFESSIFFDQKAQHLMCDSLQGICQMGNVVIFQDKNLACKTSTNCPSGKFCLQGKCVDKKKDCPIYQTRMSLCNGPEIKLHFAGEGLTSSQVKSQLDKILPTFFSVYPYNEIKDCFTITYSSQNKKEEDSCNYQNADVAVFLRPQFGRSATEKGSNTIVLFLFHQSHPGYVLAHELGHAIASLSDEYYEEAQSPIAGLNCLPIKPVEAFSSAEDVWAKYGFSGLADKAVKNNWVGCGYLPSRLKDKFIRPSQNSIMNDINGQNGHEFNALSKKILQQKIRERFK